MTKTLRNKKNNKTTKKNLSGGSTSVWKDLLKLSVIPTLSKTGGSKKSLKKKLYKPLGNYKANKLMKGGFIRSGSTQFFPVNCTRMNNQTNSQNIKSEFGGKRKNSKKISLRKKQKSSRF